jgi:hypothetical protein
MEGMEKQTAVEWLANEITNRITRRNPHDTIIIQTQGEILIELIEQAKEMEKEQIINAREDGHVSTYAEYGETPKCYLDGGHEQYYNETFKSE